MPILVVGDANADLSAALTSFPAEGDDRAISALGWGSGGAAANVATGLALLGGRARLLVRVGGDPAAEIALRAAREAGVELAFVQHDPQVATGLCFAVVSGRGERTFFSFRGANVNLESPGEVALNDIGWLHLSGHALLEGQQRTTALGLIADASRRAIPISLDLCLPLLRAWPAGVIALLPQIQLLFANEQEFGALLPDLSLEVALERLPDLGVGLAAIKRGPAGCELVGREQRWHVPAFPVVPIDSNGCGDAFAAGFIHAYQHGTSLEECALLGHALGALAVTRPGAADALPSRAELRAFLAEHLAAPAAEHLLALLR